MVFLSLVWFFTTDFTDFHGLSFDGINRIYFHTNPLPLRVLPLSRGRAFGFDWGLVFHQLTAFRYEQLVIGKGVTAISGVLKMGFFAKKSFRGKAPFSFFQNVGM
jgi:hypothetical protein